MDRCVARDVQNPAESASELSTADRTDPQAFEGTWKAYDLTAVPIDEEDPVTGTDWFVDVLHLFHGTLLQRSCL